MFPFKFASSIPDTPCILQYLELEAQMYIKFKERDYLKNYTDNNMYSNGD